MDQQLQLLVVNSRIYEHDLAIPPHRIAEQVEVVSPFELLVLEAYSGAVQVLQDFCEVHEVALVLERNKLQRQLSAALEDHEKVRKAAVKVYNHARLTVWVGLAYQLVKPLFCGNAIKNEHV